MRFGLAIQAGFTEFAMKLLIQDRGFYILGCDITRIVFFGDFYRYAVSINDHIAPANGDHIGQNLNFIIDAGLKLDHRAAAHTQQVIDRHGAPAYDDA
jgi:hypothetical protein